MVDARTYIRVHDGMDEHPKIEALSDAAFRALHRCWGYASRNLTDGRLTDTAWRNRAKTPKVRRELVDAGLVHEADHDCPHEDCQTAPSGHVQMHDYLDWQRSAEEVAELKRKRAEAGAKGGKAKAKRQANAKQVPQQAGSKNVPSTESEIPTEQPPDSGRESLDSNARGDTPPRCPQHRGLRREDSPACWACKGLREDWEAWRSADEVFERPPWCGDCDQFTRLVETDEGMARCATCHPLVHGEPA